MPAQSKDKMKDIWRSQFTDRCDRDHSLWRYHAVLSPPISAWRFCVYPRLALQMPCWKACHSYSLDLASCMKPDSHSLSWNNLNPNGKGCASLSVFCKLLKNAEGSWDLSNVEFPVLGILYYYYFSKSSLNSVFLLPAIIVVCCLYDTSCT